MTVTAFDLLWAFALGAIVAAVFTRIGWGYQYIGSQLDEWFARWR